MSVLIEELLRQHALGDFALIGIQQAVPIEVKSLGQTKVFLTNAAVLILQRGPVNRAANGGVDCCQSWMVSG